MRFQISQLSIVPAASSPRSALARAPGTESSSQRIFGPAKYVAIGRPVCCRKRSCEPSSAHNAAVRVSCQTIAFAIGRPVPRSQITVVSRWFVIPTAARPLASIPAARKAPATTCCVRSQISSGSCSTHPGWGKRCSCSRWSTPAIAPARSKIMHRVLVVP